MKWTILDPAGPLSPRSSHVSGLILDRNNNLELVVLFGGTNGSLRNDSWAMNCSSREWRPLKLNIPPSASSAYASSIDHHLYIFGGLIRNPEYFLTNRLLMYDHSIESLVSIEPSDVKFIPPPLMGASMIYFKWRLFIYGGIDAHARVSDKLYIFDLKKKEWAVSDSKNAPPGRFGHSMNLWFKTSQYTTTVDATEPFIVIYGGCLGVDNGMQSSGDVWLYSIEKNYWDHPKLNDYPHGYSGRSEHTAFLHGSNLRVFGGIKPKKENITDLSDYEVASDMINIKLGQSFCTFSRLPQTIPIARAGHSFVHRFKGSQGIVFGGYTVNHDSSYDLNDLLVLDFNLPGHTPMKYDKGFIKWDDLNNIHGLNNYKLIILESPNQETTVYEGNNSFWMITGLRPSKRYFARLIVSNTLGSSLDSLIFEFRHDEYIFPPQRVSAKIENSNIVLKWECAQPGLSFILFHRLTGIIYGSRYARSKDTDSSSAWTEISAGTTTQFEKPVKDFIGDSSSRDTCSNIEFQVVAASNFTRSEPSIAIVLSLEEYLQRTLSANISVSAEGTEELMIEGKSDPNTTGNMDDDFEELAEGDTVRPGSASDEKSQLTEPKSGKKSSKFKIKRDYKVEQQLTDGIKKKEQNNTFDMNSQKRKLQSELQAKIQGKSLDIEDNPTSLDCSQSDSGDLVEIKKKIKVNNQLSPQKNVKERVKPEHTDIELSNHESMDFQPSNHLMNVNKIARAPDDPPEEQNFDLSQTVETHPVSQRLQLKRIIEQQGNSGNNSIEKIQLPNTSDIKPLFVTDVAEGEAEESEVLMDLETTQIVESSFANKNSLESEAVKDISRDHSSNKISDLSKMLMHPKRHLGYNLNYGDNLQVLYDDDWWRAKAMFYAYDSNLSLYLKVHFPGWRRSEDLYVPLDQCESTIRDDSITVEKKLPTYTPSKFKFEIHSDKPHGITKEGEIDFVRKNGYLLREIEKNARFLGD